MSAMRVNERQSVTETKFEPSSKAKQGAPVEKDKDTLSSASPSSSEQPKRTLGEKIKAFFAAIGRWITAHILCCFFRKKEEKAPEEAKEVSPAAAKLAAIEEFTDIEKGKAFKKFNSLSPEDRKLWLEVIKKFRSKESEHADIKKGKLLYPLLLENTEASQADIYAMIEQAPISDSFKNELKAEFLKGRPKFFGLLKLALHSIDHEEKFGEGERFLSIVEGPRGPIENWSPVFIHAIYRNLNTATKLQLLASYKAANGKGITSDKLLSRFLEDSPHEKVVKMMSQFKKASEEYLAPFMKEYEAIPEAKEGAAAQNSPTANVPAAEVSTNAAEKTGVDTSSETNKGVRDASPTDAKSTAASVEDKEARTKADSTSETNKDTKEASPSNAKSAAASSEGAETRTKADSTSETNKDTKEASLSNAKSAAASVEDKETRTEADASSEVGEGQKKPSPAVARQAAIEAFAEREQIKAAEKLTLLTPDELEQWKKAVSAFMKKMEGPKTKDMDLGEIVKFLSPFLENEGATIEEIVAAVNKSNFSEREKNILTKDITTNKEDMFDQLKRSKNYLEFYERFGEVVQFVSFVSAAQPQAPLEIEAVYRNLKVETKVLLLEIYKKVNGNGILSDRLLGRCQQNPQHQKVLKMFERFKADVVEAVGSFPEWR